MGEVNPWRPPAADLRVAPRDATDREYAAFVGPNSATYVARWSGLRRGTSITAGFNWSCFFAGPTWWAYRRMYPEFAGVWAVVSCSTLAELWIARATNLDQRVVSIAINVLDMAFYVVLGFAANLVYFRRARRAISEAAIHAADSAAGLEAIARRGGVSRRAAWLAVLGTFGFTALMLLPIL